MAGVMIDERMYSSFLFFFFFFLRLSFCFFFPSLRGGLEGLEGLERWMDGWAALRTM